MLHARSRTIVIVVLHMQSPCISGVSLFPLFCIVDSFLLGSASTRWVLEVRDFIVSVCRSRVFWLWALQLGTDQTEVIQVIDLTK